MYSPDDSPCAVRAAPAKNRTLSTIGGISSLIVTSAGLPAFWASILTNSSALDSIASASLRSASWRSLGVESNQVSSNAFLAAATARFASSAVPSWTEAITAPVCGLMMSRVPPSDELTHSPPMNI